MAVCAVVGKAVMTIGCEVGVVCVLGLETAPHEEIQIMHRQKKRYFRAWVPY
jgi:hypothetical protein